LSPAISYTQHGSVFQVRRADLDRSGQDYPEDQSFDLAIVQFLDDGSLTDPTQLKRATEAIEAARRLYKTGAVVVAFIHGWHHDADWDIDAAGGDQHFMDFRRVLMTLALRELERGPDRRRRVVGVYLSWNGDPDGSLFGKGSSLRNLSFWNRLRTARKVSRQEDIRRTLTEIVAHTKQTLDDHPDLPSSPLILVGHSMGALILEAAFLFLLSNFPAVASDAARRREQLDVETYLAEQLVDFPDLVLLLNSAAGGDVARQLGVEVLHRQLRREVRLNHLRYPAPVVISATSSRDLATRVAWRFGNLPWRKAEGHDKRLRTHDLIWTGQVRQCFPKQLDNLATSFGQPWHCLRSPVADTAGRHAFPIDLPTTTPLQEGLQAAFAAQHTRCILTPVQPTMANAQEDPRPSPLWMVRLPSKVSRGHNDIFNPRASLLILAFMQISGAIVSLGEALEEVFEPEAP
jgi:hypothetical protein